MKWIFVLTSLSFYCLNAVGQGAHCGTVQPEGAAVVIPRQVQLRDVITIPVVFHVVWKEEEENISEEQILNQLEILNKDFRATNDQSNVPVTFQSRIADCEIEFCLATRLPDSSPTSGIIRVQTNEEVIGLKEILYTTAPAVDSEHYLNVWIADLGTGLNGKATFPETVPAYKDGVIISAKFVGNIGTAEASEPYNLGRTLTHEIGHYLNLYHVFGQMTNGSCGSDDLVEDTPNSNKTYLGQCPTAIEFSCNSSDMWMNFMYYTNDACMSMFSQGQKARMLATLEGARFGLTNSEGCIPSVTVKNENTFDWNVYPNPAGEWMYIDIGTSKNVKLTLFNAQGQQIQTQKIDFSTQLATAHLSKGIYYITLEMNTLITIKKIIKI